ncbi:hypothetical protein BB561_002011 [Smittium simulii]|uniref:Rho-GAP domain-containing protein n=1 Tax=Smittium simulii TaxID=133385 RepID=A0A2T9YS51_9FUNG|nr:hypothetical protein BB561_002011 [Smittium simulii]
MSPNASVQNEKIVYKPNEWIKILDSTTEEILFINPCSGDFAPQPPKNSIVKNKDPSLVWWEIYDESNNLPFYFNSVSKVTEWEPPKKAIIIPSTLFNNNNEDEDSAFDHSDNENFYKNDSHKLDDSIGFNKMKLENSSVGFSRPSYEDSQKSTVIDTDYKNSDSASDIKLDEKSTSDLDILVHDSDINQKNIFTDLKIKNHDQVVAISNSDNKSDTGILHNSPVKSIKDNKNSKAICDRIPRDKTTQKDDDQDSRSSSVEGKNDLKTLVEFLNAGPQDFQDSKASGSLDQNYEKSIRITEDPDSYVNFEDFADKNFVTPKRGLFRRKLTKKDLVSYTYENLDCPLLDIPKKYHKYCMDIFYIIQSIMNTSVISDSMHEIKLTQQLVQICSTTPDVIDEMYCQLSKQLTRNFNLLAVKKGWVLYSVISLACCPRSTRPFILLYVHDQMNRFEKYIKESTIYVDIYMAISRSYYCIKRFMDKGSVRVRILKREEIRLAEKIASSPPLFGAPLENLMKFKEMVYTKKKIPLILCMLLEAIKSLNGHVSEGLFRVPGDSDKVFSTRLKLEAGQKVSISENEVNVYASLLKEWLRELKYPLIDPSKYMDCINSPSDVKNAHKIIKELPILYQRTSIYLLEFLNFLSIPEHSAKTKMSISNLALVFSPSFLRSPTNDLKLAFSNTTNEQTFIETLILNPLPPIGDIEE